MKRKHKILVACEYSGRVRDAFAEQGHQATSCDLLPSEAPGNHLQCDVREIDLTQYDMLIAHPPCTMLCSAGARWWCGREKEQEDAIAFFMWFAKAPVKRKAIENPIGIMSRIYRKPDQIIQPWQFGHGETKATCLWLCNLPKLSPTKIVEGREARIHRMSPSNDRGKKRSLTYIGIAKAMAQQWSFE